MTTHHTDEIREARRRAGRASGVVRREMRDGSVTVRLYPRVLTPSQRAAWMNLWRVLLGPEHDEDGGPSHACPSTSSLESRGVASNE
ncbi:MAG UNVERIFIED_CONTAM: hypothetical protein LOD86_08775 [Thermobifida fusca]